jgi:alkanesulfonate monooxygenase SsuD/methylene tetrahydromethanopterin reductase-like flavin-dependent oxidoreductase (luciferase family)
MRYGIIVNTGNPHELVEMATEAEAAGWDGVFYFDGVSLGSFELYDPWVVLGAMAVRTERVTLGLILTPPSRRRPWKLARETMTVDRLSAGRLVLPVGLGALDDQAFGNVGEATDARTRAELMDETLAILDGLWSGEKFGFTGKHYRFKPMIFRPTPVQRPRIPIWPVAVWGKERTMRRALRWDGILAQSDDLDDLRSMADYVRRERPAELSDRSFDIVVQGSTTKGRESGPDEVARLADAGATWWIGADWERGTLKSIRARIAAGPPRI